MFPEENWFDGGIGPQIFPNFFWSCYSSFLDLESIVATPNEFFSFKKSNNLIKNDSFSLIDSNVSHNQNTKQNLFLIITAKLNQNKKKKLKKKKLSRLTQFGDGGGKRGAAAW